MVRGRSVIYAIIIAIFELIPVSESKKASWRGGMLSGRKRVLQPAERAKTRGCSESMFKELGLLSHVWTYML